MGANTESLGLDKLPVEEKVALINELWADIVAEERSHPISEELARKLDQRVAEYEANPDDTYSVDEVMATLQADRKE